MKTWAKVGLVFIVAYFSIAAYGKYRTTQEVLVAEPVEQIYAGEPLPQRSAVQDAKPSLYSCADEKMRVYLVIASSGEFMMFDGKGAWVNHGRFFEAQTDQGVNYWHAELGSSLLGMSKKDSTWHLAIVTPKSTMDLICV